MTPARIAADELLATARVFALPLRTRFRGVMVREGVLVRGPVGWAEFAPFRDYDDAECVPWWRAAVEAATRPWPPPHRQHVEVNAIVPVLSPGGRCGSGPAQRLPHCEKVKVADPGVPLAADAERVAAVRDALGPAGAIRVDANGAWPVETAVAAIRLLDRAAGGLQYVEQPCPTVPELAQVRRRVEVPIAADESIRRAADPLAVARAGAADVAVVKVAPLGGMRATLQVAQDCGLPVVVSSAVDSAVGLAAGLAVAGALPALPFACGFGTGDLLSRDVSAASADPVDGRLPVPSAAPQPDELEQADAETTRYWLARLRRVAALADAMAAAR